MTDAELLAIATSFTVREDTLMTLGQPANGGHPAVTVDRTCKAGEGPWAPPHDWWAVRSFGRRLNRDGEWEMEPRPSERDEDFLGRTTFTRDEAIRRGLAAPGLWDGVL